jgi:hypothetical protein
MKVLHLLRSEPDETVMTLFQWLSREAETSVVELYGDAVDWNQLVEDIFENDRVICWW